MSDTLTPPSFQNRVLPWMLECFGPIIPYDRLERGDRLLEEVLELLQSGNYPKQRIAALVEYVYSRDIGDPKQEVGGVMVTLAAYCLAHNVDMHDAAETELARIWTKVEQIRAKQASKPTGSALPVAFDGVPWPQQQRKGAQPVSEERLSIPAGLEPATSRLVGDRSIQLSYGRSQEVGTESSKRNPREGNILVGHKTPEYANAEAAFSEYFVSNYPGPDTVIFDPNWHAPKIFYAAFRALASVRPEGE